MNDKKIRNYLIIAGIAVIVCYIVQNFAFITNVLSMLKDAVSPLVMGAVIAYIFNIIMKQLEKIYFPKSRNSFINSSRRPVCIVLSFLFAVAIIVLVLTIVIPSIINASELLTAKIPPYLNKAEDYILNKLEQYPDIQNQAMEFIEEFDAKSIDLSKFTENIFPTLKSGFVSILSSTAKFIRAVAGTTANIVIAIIFAIYLLARKDKILTDIKRILRIIFSPRTNTGINKIFTTLNETFRQFFIGQFIEAVILGLLCFIGMAVLRLPYAGMSGVIIGVTALVPIVGALIGAAVCTIIILTENPMQALIFLIFLILLQQAEENLIYPKVVGNSVGLPGIWVLAAITAGGSLWGITGMIISVPLVASVYKLGFEKLAEKESETEPPEPEPESENPEDEQDSDSGT